MILDKVFETKGERSEFIAGLFEKGFAIVCEYEESGWFGVQFESDTQAVWNDDLGAFV